MASSGISQQAVPNLPVAEALRIAMCEEQPAYIAQILLDMERSRMFAEDCRAAMASPYSTNDLPPHRRTLSWREFGSLERIRLNMLGIDPAIDLLQEARHEILVALSQGGVDVNTSHTALVKAMGTVHTAMVNAEFRLQSSREVFPER